MFSGLCNVDQYEWLSIQCEVHVSLGTSQSDGNNDCIIDVSNDTFRLCHYLEVIQSVGIPS